ncbi:hypothetical protein QBC44DRAFT_384614 [Cladorrhinum sp. PSN332]|nr:hypothetical protein QBC44DRAFT_384614 [Cladorrhinum sp. PSN332]
MPPPRKNNLLLCFDAFGTLIKPNQPVLKQYADVAEECGLKGLDASRLRASFGAAYRAESKAHPNFGRASDMGGERWWGNVIQSTFLPLLPASQKEVPPQLTKKLLRRFSSLEGYDLTVPDLGSLLRRIKSRREGQTIVGVVTNSDDRIPGILTSFGLDVSPFRYGRGSPSATRRHDVDFHCMSYDVGFTKPSNVIFDAGMVMGLSLAEREREKEGWIKVYVGDEVGNDLLGGSEAGWHTVLVADEEADGIGERVPEGLEDLEDRRGEKRELEDVFPCNGIGLDGEDHSGEIRKMRAGSLRGVLEWFGRH